MDTYLLLLLLVCIGLQVMMLLHFFRKKFRNRLGTFSVQNKEEATAVVKFLNAYNKMIAIKWYVDMMMDGDFGSLNIAQIQFLHQMSMDAEIALQDMQAITTFEAERLPEQIKHMQQS